MNSSNLTEPQKGNFEHGSLGSTRILFRVHSYNSCVTLVLSVTTLCESGKAERQASIARARGRRKNPFNPYNLWSKI
jgi:hypothetical protein